MTSLKFMALPMHNSSSICGARAAVVLGVVLALAPIPALAEAQVRGSPAAVSVEAQNASIEDLLVALGSSFDVHYQSSTKLEKQLTGTYEGPLQRVLTRILDGYNFIVKTSKGRTEIIVLGPRNAPGATGAPLASADSKAGPTPPAMAAVASTSTKVVEKPAAATPPPSIKVAEEKGPVPVAVSSAAPAPVPKLAEGAVPAVPLPTPSTSGGVPAPEPQPSNDTLPVPSSASDTSAPEAQASTAQPPIPAPQTQPTREPNE